MNGAREHTISGADWARELPRARAHRSRRRSALKIKLLEVRLPADQVAKVHQFHAVVMADLLRGGARP